MSLEFRQNFWHRKTRVSGLSYGVVSLILGLAIFVQLRLVTDGQTDRRTANTALAQRRAVKMAGQTSMAKCKSLTGSAVKGLITFLGFPVHLVFVSVCSSVSMYVLSSCSSSFVFIFRLRVFYAETVSWQFALLCRTDHKHSKETRPNNNKSLRFFTKISLTRKPLCRAFTLHFYIYSIFVNYSYGF